MERTISKFYSRIKLLLSFVLLTLVTENSFGQDLSPSTTTTGSQLLEAEGLNRQIIKLNREGKYEDAIPLAQQALQIYAQQLGPKHPDIAILLDNLAYLYCTNGDLRRAESFYRQALISRWEKLGPEHLLTTQSVNNMASLYLAMGRHGLADRVLELALKLMKKAQPADYAGMIQALYGFAQFYETKNELGRALYFYQRIVDIPSKEIAGNELSFAHFDLTALVEQYINLLKRWDEKRNEREKAKIVHQIRLLYEKRKPIENELADPKKGQEQKRLALRHESIGTKIIETHREYKNKEKEIRGGTRQ